MLTVNNKSLSESDLENNDKAVEINHLDFSFGKGKLKNRFYLIFILF